MGAFDITHRRVVSNVVRMLEVSKADNRVEGGVVMQRLLIVEDDKQIRDELRILLQRNGYEVLVLESFESVVNDSLALAPNLVLLDLNLPGVDGHFICRELRLVSSIPLIVVTSRDTDMDELLSMNFGADDFVAKPYNAQVLLAHIASVLKRVYGDQAAVNQISYRGLILDQARCEVVFEGQAAELTKNELRILGVLLRNAGAVVTRQRIQEELWQSDEFVDDNTLTVNISYLRQTLDGIGARGFIQTRRGIGYVID